MHWIFYVDAAPAGVTEEDWAAEFCAELQGGLWGYARKAMLSGDEATWAMFERLGERALDVRPAGLEIGRSLAKVSGAGIGSTAAEVSDATGSKSDPGHTNDVALAFWAAQVATDHGYTWRRWRKAIAQIPAIARAFEHAARWEAARGGTQLWSCTAGMFDKWAHLGEGDELIAEALKVCEAQDVAALRILLGLDPEPEPPNDPAPAPDDDSDDDSQFGAASCAESALGLPAEAPPEYPKGWRRFSVDAGVVDSYLNDSGVEGVPDAEMCHLLDQEPSMMLAAQTLAWAHLRQTGEVLAVWERLPAGGVDNGTRDDMQQIYLGAEDMSGLPGWREIQTIEMGRRVATAQRWERNAVMLSEGETPRNEPVRNGPPEGKQHEQEHNADLPNGLAVLHRRPGHSRYLGGAVPRR